MSSRPDGRSPDAFRPLTISYDGLARVDGSARFGFGNTTAALASVSGPVEVRLAAELPSQATFDVSVRPLSNVPATEAKAQAAAIRAALAPSLILTRNPRSLLQLVVQSLAAPKGSGSGSGRGSGSGSGRDALMAAMINAGTLALLNAGSVPMRGVVCAVAVGKTGGGEFAVDPNEEEEETSAAAAGGRLVGGGCFAFMLADGVGVGSGSGSTCVWADWKAIGGGTFAETDLVAAREAAREAVGRIFVAIKGTFSPVAVSRGVVGDHKMDV